VAAGLKPEMNTVPTRQILNLQLSRGRLGFFPAWRWVKRVIRSVGPILRQLLSGWIITARNSPWLTSQQHFIFCCARWVLTNPKSQRGDLLAAPSFMLGLGWRQDGRPAPGI
jgi:hypothetical protein